MNWIWWSAISGYVALGMVTLLRLAYRRGMLHKKAGHTRELRRCEVGTCDDHEIRYQVAFWFWWACWLRAMWDWAVGKFEQGGVNAVTPPDEVEKNEGVSP